MDYVLMDKEVDGVAGQNPLRPAPATVFDNQAGKGGQDQIAGLTFE